MRPDKVDIDKKHSHCLRNCLIVSLVMIVLLCGALFGGAFFAYDHFAKPIVKISMFEAFDVIGSLGKFKEDEIVTNPFTQADADAFYANFEAATCIDLPEGFKISDAVNAVMESTNKEEGGTEPAPKPTEPTTEGKSDSPLAGLNDFSTHNEYLDNLLRNTKFDFANLKDYENTGKDLVLEDKQFAAIMNEVIQNLNIKQVKDIEEKLGLSIKDFVSIKQVEITAPSSAEMMLMSNSMQPMPYADAPTVTNKDIKISLTLCVDLGKNVETIISHAAGDNGMINFAAKIASGILPKKIFVGLGVYPYDETKKPDIFINSIKDDVMDNLQTAVSGILEYTGSDKTMDGLLLDVSKVVTKTVDTMEQMVGKLTFIDSSLEMDPIALLMTALKINPKDPVTGEIKVNVNRHNFFGMLQHIYYADNSIINEDFLAFIKEKMGEAFNAIATDAEYKDEITEFSDAFGIDTTQLNIAEWKPEEFITRYKEIPEHINVVDKMINVDGVDMHIYDIPQAKLKEMTSLSDKTLGHIMNAYLESSFKETNNEEVKPDGTTPEGTTPEGTTPPVEPKPDGALSKLPFRLEVSSIRIYEAENEDGTIKPDEYMLDIVLALDTNKLIEGLGEESVLRNLIDSLIPNNLYMRANVPLTKKAGNSGIGVNFVGKKETEESFDTLYNIVNPLNADTAEKMKLENILKMIDDAISKMLDEIDKVFAQLEQQAAEGKGEAVSLAGEPVPEEESSKLEFSKGNIVMPTVYDIIKMISGDKTLKAEDIQPVLQGMYTYDATKQSESIDSIDGFIATELEGKLFLNNVDAGGNKIYTSSNLLDQNTGITKIGDRVKTEGVGNVIRARDLIDDTTRTTVDQLKLAIKANELAAMINGSKMLDSVVKDLPYNKATVAQGATIKLNSEGAYVIVMTIIAENDPSIVPPTPPTPPTPGDGTATPEESKSPMGIKLENILPAELQITAEIVLDGANKYSTTVDMNGINTPDKKGVLDNIIKGLVKDDKGAGLSFAKIEEMIGTKMSESLKSFEAQGKELGYSEEGSGSIIAMSVYDVIYDNLLKPKLTAEQQQQITNQDVMDIFKMILADVEATPAVAGDLNALAQDINNKMLLKNDTIKANSIMGSMSGISKNPDNTTNENNVFDALEPDKIWTLGYTSADMMNIKISAEQMLSIMKQEMNNFNMTGIPAFLSKPDLATMVISGVNIIDLQLNSTVNKTVSDEQYKDIIPFMPNNMLMKANINVQTGEITLLMNNLDAEHLDKANIIMGALATDFNMDTIKNQVKGEVTKAFDELDSVGMPLTFDPTEGVTTGNIFDVLVKLKKDEDIKNGTHTFDTLTDVDLHRIMRGLRAPADEQAKAIFNPKVNEAVNQPVFVPNLMAGNVEVTVEDEFIAYGLFKGTIKTGGADSAADGTIKQMAVLTGNGLNYVKTDTKFAPQYSTAFTDGCTKALAITIEVNTAAYNTLTGGISKILPGRVTVTAILEITGTTANDVTITPLINNMTKADMDILEKLMGDSENNVMKKVSNMVKEQVLNVAVIKKSDRPELPRDITLGDILLQSGNVYNDLTTTGGKPNADGVMGSLTVTISLESLQPKP